MVLNPEMLNGKAVTDEIDNSSTQRGIVGEAVVKIR